jgi:very-short-patch-repair endonuclease
MRGKYDTNLAELATRQHGVVSRADLLGLGVGEHAIDRLVRAGRLHRLYRGVYAVGHNALTLHGRWMAAVLACGLNAALSHTTATAALDLRRAGETIHVTVPGRGGRQAPKGIKLHRSPTLTPAEITTVRGIRVTRPARTIIDVARLVSRDELARIVEEADRRGLVDFRELEAARSPSLHAVLRAYAPAPTRSALERRFLKLCRDHGIERPEVNAVIEGMEVDFVWRDRKLIVEVDGYEFHRSRGAFERDRERDVELAMRGWTTRRFTWRQVESRSQWVAAAIG